MTTPSLDVDGVAAPPRRNGELAFDAPWQSRCFGLTVALCEAGAVDWEDFRGRLIARIAAWEAAHGSAPTSEGAEPGHSYWDHWQSALVDVAAAAGLLTEDAVAALAVELADRPAGHDHDHPHGHGHDGH